MMKEQLVSLEVAKLAKEKGFNPFKIDNKLSNAIINTGAYTYIETRNIRTTSYYFYKEDDKKVECHEMKTGELSSRYGSFNSVVDHYFGKETESNYYHAPTQSLLQKWLRDVHNIHVQAEYDANHKSYLWRLWFDPGSLGLPYFKSHVDTEWTWEQALEKGLLEALKLIKDV